MLTIGICEDDPWSAARLREETEIFLAERQIQAAVFVYSSGEELLAAGAGDVLLMDIKLPGKNGMAVVRRLRAEGRSCQIIFITSYENYVFQAFDVEAVHYLLKPVDTGKLRSVLERALRRAAAEREDKVLMVAAGDGVARVRFRDIVYCEVLDHRLSIYTVTETYAAGGTLDSLERELDSRFFRCHRSYLVNMDFVVGRKDGCAVMAGGRQALVSRRRQQEFARRLLESCRRGGI